MERQYNGYLNPARAMLEWPPMTSMDNEAIDLQKIVVLNPKGGSGKTTIATNLAAYFALAGYNTALMDFDSQGSSTRWLSKRPEDSPPIHGVAMFESHAGMTRSFATRLPADAERVIVDTPAALAKHEFVDMTRGADRILIPVLPSDIDIHAAARCIADLLLVAKISRHENRIAIVANRVKRNTLVFRALMRFLESLDIPLATTLTDSQQYIRASERGLGVHELVKSKSNQELEHWRSLTSWLAQQDGYDAPALSPGQPETSSVVTEAVGEPVVDEPEDEPVEAPESVPKANVF